MCVIDNLIDSERLWYLKLETRDEAIRFSGRMPLVLFLGLSRETRADAAERTAIPGIGLDAIEDYRRVIEKEER